TAIPAVAIRMRGAADIGALFRLRRFMRARDVSLIHTHSSIDSWLGAIAARSLGRPVVRSRHVSIPIRRRRALVYRLADRIITSGEAVRALVIASGVAPERAEAIPQVIPQALAVGTPVVASTVGGSPELICDGENGRLVPPADPGALAAAILDLLRDPERARAMARAGQAMVRERYTIDTTMA